MTLIPRVAGGLICMVGLALMAISAPATKEKAEPPGPIKEEQLAASKEKLQQIALAIINCSDTDCGKMPTNIVGKDGKALLSWRVQILPYMEETVLYKQFKLDEAWDSAHNKKLIDKMPAVFAPVRVRTDKGMTYYQALGGKHGWLQSGKPVNFPAAFTDGTSQTFLVIEGAKPVEWTKPEDLEYDGKTLPKFGGLFDGRFHAAMADGSVHRFRADAPAITLGRLIDPADGEAVDIDMALDEEKK